MSNYRLILLASLLLGCGARALGPPDDAEHANIAATIASPEPSTLGPDSDCLAAPLACERGSVCAPDDGNNFRCRLPGPGVLGEPCDRNAIAPCGEGLVCTGSVLLDTGFCYAWCDVHAASSVCPSGTTCRLIEAGSGRQGPSCVGDVS